MQERRKSVKKLGALFLAQLRFPLALVPRYLNVHLNWKQHLF